MVGILCLVFFAPLLVLAAITIRLDSPGPVFSLQDRCGFKKTIRRYTFRTTMSRTKQSPRRPRRPDSDEVRSRRLSQLINVVRAERSLVATLLRIFDSY
jgi:lipopolysaccharide/colanic/teichoic acid biosynthesis glycosyltransferase